MNGIIEITGAFTNSFAINLTTANNGLSKSNPTTVVLGQDIGAVGDPALVTSSREIPLDVGQVLEIRAGTPFTSGAQSMLGLTNNFAVSGIPFVITIDQIDDAAAAINIINNAIGGFGSRIQMTSGGATASGLFGVFGDNAGLGGKKNFTYISTNNVANGGILFQTNPRNAPGGAGYFTFWGTDGVATEQEYYRIIPPVTAVLDFPNTAAQTSSDLNVNLPGARDGDAVLLGVPNGSMNANSNFSAWVSANDVVTVRFNNYSAAGIDPASGTFKVGVIRILP